MAAALPAVRMVSPVLSASPFGYVVNATAGGSESLGSMPNSCASGTMPITSSQLKVRSPLSAILNRCPIGLSPGHRRRAMVSLTTATLR